MGSVEERIRLGNPSRRPIPDRTLKPVPSVQVHAPEPTRELGTDGRATWNRVWAAGASWIAPSLDTEMVLLLCEQIDERASLRRLVLQYQDPKDRAALRRLETQILTGLNMLGLNPLNRARLGATHVAAESMIDKLRRERGAT